jgi:hypothetical protein
LTDEKNWDQDRDSVDVRGQQLRNNRWFQVFMYINSWFRNFNTLLRINGHFDFDWEIIKTPNKSYWWFQHVLKNIDGFKMSILFFRKLLVPFYLKFLFIKKEASVSSPFSFYLNLWCLNPLFLTAQLNKLKLFGKTCLFYCLNHLQVVKCWV